MNEVWKNLDPIFQITLRKYVKQNNQSLFEVYAKALGFQPNHIQLLYNTLQNVECHQCGVTDLINRKRSYSEMNNTYNQNEDNNDHNQIYNKRIKTEHHNNNSNQLQWHSISVYNDIACTNNDINHDINNYEQRTNTEIDSKSVIRNTIKQDQPLIHSVVVRDIFEITNSNNTNSSHSERSESSMIKSTSTTNTKSKSINLRTGVSKIPSPLPLYNIYRSPVYSKKYQELIVKSNETRKQNNNYDVVLSKYQKLKNLSSQSFKAQYNKNSTKDIAVSNKKKIDALLAHCHSYKNLLNKRGKKLNQNSNGNNRIIRKTTASQG